MLCARQCFSWLHLASLGPVMVFLPPPMVSSPVPRANAGKVSLRDGHTSLTRGSHGRLLCSAMGARPSLKAAARMRARSAAFALAG